MHYWLALIYLHSAAAPELAPRGFEFFSDRIVPGGFVESIATTAIPYRPEESCYRWVIHVKPEARMVPLREVFKLPAPAPHWGGVDGDPESPTAVTSQRDGATTQLLDSASDGELSNSWCVAKGDPEGRYSISVLTGDLLLHRFEFTVGGAR